MVDLVSEKDKGLVDGSGSPLNVVPSMVAICADRFVYGDHALKVYMISEPEVIVIQRSELDGFIIIATDGLWDAISNVGACEVVEKCLAGHTRRTLIGETTKSLVEAAVMLAELAIAKGSKGTISVIQKHL
ncbi:hypothetical protein QQ045_002055 [Rhodiola kirilowii]